MVQHSTSTNPDGVHVYSFSVPFYYVCRFTVRNILLCGVWYSKSKPENMHTFLKPVIDSINDLYTKGKVSTVVSIDSTISIILLSYSYYFKVYK